MCRAAGPTRRDDRPESLHVTVGVNVRRWIDEARAEVYVQERELAFRETIDGDAPPGSPPAPC